MSWSFSHAGKPVKVLEDIDKSVTEIVKDHEKFWPKEANVMREHLHALRQFLTTKLSNLGSNGEVMVKAWGHKSEGEVHEIGMAIEKHRVPTSSGEVPVATSPEELPVEQLSPSEVSRVSAAEQPPTPEVHNVPAPETAER